MAKHFPFESTGCENTHCLERLPITNASSDGSPRFSFQDEEVAVSETKQPWMNWKEVKLQ
eukprot:c44601_g1_i1 orf=3-179(-)